MRLREPFSGYMLSSGHFMFHIAYLLGSYIAFEYVLEGKAESVEQYNVLWQLNCAHILVPIFQILSTLLGMKGYFSIQKFMNICSIF